MSTVSSTLFDALEAQTNSFAVRTLDAQTLLIEKALDKLHADGVSHCDIAIHSDVSEPGMLEIWVNDIPVYRMESSLLTLEPEVRGCWLHSEPELVEDESP